MPRLLTLRLTYVAWLSGLFLLVASARAQESEILVLPRLDGPIQLDGLSNEPAWEAVTPWLPTQYEPDNGAPPTEHTEFLVAYDADYIYFALRAYDSDQHGIRSNTLYRDRLSGDDHFEILLDTFNDNETAVLFTTTPGGHSQRRGDLQRRQRRRDSLGRMDQWGLQYFLGRRDGGQ